MPKKGSGKLTKLLYTGLAIGGGIGGWKLIDKINESQGRKIFQHTQGYDPIVQQKARVNELKQALKNKEMQVSSLDSNASLVTKQKLLNDPEYLRIKKELEQAKTELKATKKQLRIQAEEPDTALKKTMLATVGATLLPSTVALQAKWLKKKKK